MERTNIIVIKHIRAKSKQSVTSQRIFRFINKGALIIDCELFQDSINRFEIDGGIYKKGGIKILHFILILLPRAAIKMMGRIR